MSGRNTVCSHELSAELIKRHKVLSDHNSEPEKEITSDLTFQCHTNSARFKICFLTDRNNLPH